MAIRAGQKAGLVFLASWVDPIAEDILGGRDDVDLRKLSHSTVEADNWDVMSRANGYQVQARTELREPWFPDAALTARCQNLLAVSPQVPATTIST